MVKAYSKYTLLHSVSAASFVLFEFKLVFLLLCFFRHRHPGLLPKKTPRSGESPEAEPNIMPEENIDGSMKNYYEAVQPELLCCLLIIPYLSLPGIQQNLSVRLKKSEGRLMEDDEVSGRGGCGALASRLF